MKYLIIFLFGFCSTRPSYSQKLKIGDKVPPFIVTRLINYPSPVNFDRFDGPVILAFWSTFCSSCIGSFKKLDRLRRELGFNIIAVNNTVKDDSLKIAMLLEKRKRVNGEQYTWPFIFQDSILSSFFPTSTVPHYVWLDKKKQVVAITSADEITHENLLNFTSGKKMTLPDRTELPPHDRSLPLLVNGNGGDDASLLYRSTLTRYLPALKTGAAITRDTILQKQSLYYHNVSLRLMYAYHFPLAGSNRLIVELSHPERFIHPNDNQLEWRNANLFCYELTCPISLTQLEVNQKANQDIEQAFQLHGRVEVRPVRCFVLERSSAGCQFLTSGAKKHNNLFDPESDEKKLTNRPVSDLIKALNYQSPGKATVPIVVNETGIDKPVDMKFLIKNIQDLEKLNTQLATFGLTLTETIRSLDVFVISEKKSRNAENP